MIGLIGEMTVGNNNVYLGLLFNSRRVLLTSFLWLLKWGLLVFKEAAEVSSIAVLSVNPPISPVFLVVPLSVLSPTLVNRLLRVISGASSIFLIIGVATFLSIEL